MNSFKKKDVIYIQNGILDVRKDENLLLTSMGMELEGIRLSETSQLEKDNDHMVSLIGGI